MKMQLKVLMVIAILVIVMSSDAFSSTYNVNVTLPTFDVKVNGVKIDNNNREYPLIVYRNITYFPMTYYDSLFLGLETKWNIASGLKISKSNVVRGYVDYTSVNKSRYQASIIRTDVEVNGKIIDNSNEQYPLLMFRDITYFPLTWRFAVEEFGWEYRFTNGKGLEIYNPDTNLGLEVMEVDLPVVENSEFRNAFTVAGDYIYFEGEGGIIYQTPVYDLGVKKAVYELPLYTHGDSYVYPSLDTVQGKAMLYYHQGGATMGTDYIYILNDDGTNETFSIGYKDRKVFDEITANVSYAVPPHSNNLSIRKDGDEEYKTIGRPDYRYGWSRMDSIGSIPSTDMYKIDDEIYILANKYDVDNDTTGIYRININTNETVRICDESAQRFVIEENILYFMDLDGYLYKIQVNGTKAEKLTGFTVSNFTVLNNVVYYVAEDVKEHELFKLGEGTSVNPGGSVKKLVRTDSYVYCIFENNSPYKLIVFNKDGTEVFKTNATIRFASINRNRLFYHK